MWLDSEKEIAQLLQWVVPRRSCEDKRKMKGSCSLIKTKLHDRGDEDITQFEGQYAQLISAWFGSYHRVVTKRLEQAKRAGRAEKASEGVLTEAEAKAAAKKG